VARSFSASRMGLLIGGREVVVDEKAASTCSENWPMSTSSSEMEGEMAIPLSSEDKLSKSSSVLSQINWISQP